MLRVQSSKSRDYNHTQHFSRVRSPADAILYPK
jgi:hypothetical protein